MRKKKQPAIITSKQNDDSVDIKGEQVGAQFKVTCAHGCEFVVEVMNPAKQIVRVTHKGSDMWPKFTVEGKITGFRQTPSPLTIYAKLPVPKKCTIAPLVERIERIH